MKTDTYDSLQEALAAVGLTGQRRSEDQLIVSSQEGPVWPNRGNSFWLSQKKEVWYLSTWLPAVYRIPESQDTVALCVGCMAVGTIAMYRVPPDLLAHFGLQEIDDEEYERLFPTEPADGDP
jgi:hypothetical protein